ncbi:CaiB/BaiF CoA transferase family protein [Leekyejoonella antrihumi]|uniref:CoA transferase n=1 Tax=Leekyejoonella antrihumi TaxID=1660198 RepID=A0A563DYG3_9MICO|nr:CaiB/BaiF CoA-transferase family protein [Leekyejoonella antrihumi]TWP35003.1 CoA transferase [Leekyejoonella antrihumi]
MGPLAGIRVLELGGKGPVPMCGMLLGDLGADVIRIDRPEEVPNPVLNRNRRSISLNLKSPEDIQAALDVAATCDAVLEGFRPGVTERLGLGPQRLLEAQPRIVVGRMTGWGQDGPWAQSPGHDINYISSSGVLHAIGTDQDPVVPLNLVADMGGGGMLLAVGVLAAILEARSSGQGQVIDAAMVDGSASLMAMMYGVLAAGNWSDQRAANRLDGAAPYYGVYRCADGHVAVGCVEPKFWADFIERMGVASEDLFADQDDRSRWPQMKSRLAEVFAAHSREHWVDTFPEGRACVTPVLSMTESINAPENVARATFAPMPGGGHWPAPAPRFSRTPLGSPSPAPTPGEHTANVLAEIAGSNSTPTRRLS